MEEDLKGSQDQLIEVSMTHEFINKILEREGEIPVILDNCVLNIRSKRSTIYLLWGDTDFNQRAIEICYADNHSEIIYGGKVNSEQELEKIILDSLKIQNNDNN